MAKSLGATSSSANEVEKNRSIINYNDNDSYNDGDDDDNE